MNTRKIFSKHMAMKVKIVTGLSILLASFGLATAAPEAPVDLRALEVSDTTLYIDWQDTSGAIGYYMYHGTQTGSGGSYEIEGIDLIEDSEYTLEGLSPDTQYYVAVTAIDSFGSESEYSEELEYKTLVQGSEAESTNFRIKDVVVIDETTLEFVFSSDLDASPSAIMEFIVEEKISRNEIGIDVSQVDTTDPKNAIILLSEPLVAALEYKVTVLDIKDASGNTIESGIDGFISFVMPVITDDEEDEVIQDTSEETETGTGYTEDSSEDTQEDGENSGTQTDLNAAGPENDTSSEVTGGNAGTTLSNEDLENNMSKAAEENDKLPQTGPELWILLLITTFIVIGGYMLRSKRHSS